MVNGDFKSGGWLSWLISVAGWLICAVFCLVFTIGLEPWPMAYDTLFPVVLLILFGNIFVFLFIVNRRGDSTKILFFSILRVCMGEGVLLAGLYVLGRYALGS